MKFTKKPVIERLFGIKDGTLYDILVKYVAFLHFIDQALHISGSKSMVYDVEVCNELLFSHSALGP